MIPLTDSFVVLMRVLTTALIAVIFNRRSEKEF